MGNSLYLSRFSSLSDYERFQSLRTAEGRRDFYRKHEIEQHQRVGFKVRSYRSGEVTGAQFRTGREGKVIPPYRSGDLITDGFTIPARVKIRRAVECSDSFLGKFCTLTFSPALVRADHQDYLAGAFVPQLKNAPLNDDGTINHAYAKEKLTRFLNTCSVKQKRLGRTLNYLWVAELQESGNIHFHILWDQFFDIKWLSKIWAQANNSVDIKRMNNPLHASRYMRKYMTKDESSEIRGNRYNISAGLRATMKPIEKLIVDLTTTEIQENPESITMFGNLRQTLQAMKDDIEDRGGKVLDFGFSAPMGRSSQEYICKVTGEKKRSKGVDPRLGKNIISILSDYGKEIRAQVAPF